MAFAIRVEILDGDNANIIFDTGSTGRAAYVRYGADSSYGGPDGPSAPATRFFGTSYKAVLSIHDLTTVHFDCFVEADESGDRSFDKSQLFVPSTQVAAKTATINWITSYDAEASVVDYGFSDQYGSKGVTTDSTPTQHSSVLSPLVPLSTYHYQVTTKAKGVSADPTKNYVLGTADQTLDTPSDAGAVDKLTAIPNPVQIPPKGQSVIKVTALDKDNKPCPNRIVECSIHNGDDRGSFSPAPAVTGNDGMVNITFTAADKKNGKAQIQVLCENKSTDCEVMVNPS